jgi:mannan endo-1,4-beta-mannosidase
MKSALVFLTLFILCSYCQQLAAQAGPIDKQATTETRMLFNNLMELSENHTLFGHQHATEMGHGWSGDSGKSDVKLVTGSHPAVIGIDFGTFTGWDPSHIQENKLRTRQIAADTYDRGGVVTASWHFPNPVSKDGFYWIDSTSVPAVKYIIPGGEANGIYKEYLREIADWANNTRGADGKLVPVIFRPFHEFEGGWFWWGAPHCTKEEFKALWRFTVTYLRDSLQVHSFIYGFSPDKNFKSRKQYLERYPGDDYVDLLGTDNYGDMGRDGYNTDLAAKKLKIISDYAEKAGKLAAFTETGLAGVPNPVWWTETLLKTMQTYHMKLCYVLVWTNYITGDKSYYAPYPGQASEQDFLKFYNDPYTLFENDLKDIYKK